MGYTHSHRCWVGIAPVREVETHQKWDAVRHDGGQAELRLADERALIQGDVATLVPPRDAAEPAPASRDDVSLISAQVRAGLMPTAVDMHAQGARVVSGLISGDGPLNVRVRPQVTVTAGEARICSVHASPAAGRRMVERYGRLSAARSPQ
jgi:hypothetical protein